MKLEQVPGLRHARRSSQTNGTCPSLFINNLRWTSHQRFAWSWSLFRVRAMLVDRVEPTALALLTRGYGRMVGPAQVPGSRYARRSSRTNGTRPAHHPFFCTRDSHLNQGFSTRDFDFGPLHLNFRSSTPPGEPPLVVRPCASPSRGSTKSPPPVGGTMNPNGEPINQSHPGSRQRPAPSRTVCLYSSRVY